MERNDTKRIQTSVFPISYAMILNYSHIIKQHVLFIIAPKVFHIFRQDAWIKVSCFISSIQLLYLFLCYYKRNTASGMLELAIKGIIIGLCISVPLGPIGMLCVQRTLNRGRKHGIVTGLGATTSDLIYTFITLFFLQFVIGFIETHQIIFQFVGAIVVAIFGIFIIKSRPTSQTNPNVASKGNLFSDFITAFGLTFSNPLILFVLIALFARFEFIADKSPFVTYFIGISSILLGAFMWWLLLTYIVSHFKNKLGLRGLRLINIVTGSIIIVIGCVGLIVSFL